MASSLVNKGKVETDTELSKAQQNGDRLSTFLRTPDTDRDRLRETHREKEREKEREINESDSKDRNIKNHANIPSVLLTYI